MSLPLNLPFLPDPDYLQFLGDLGPRLQTVQYALNDPAVHDARLRGDRVELAVQVELLRSLPAPRKYLLVNARLHPAASYRKDGLRQLTDRLESLSAAGVLDGLVFADAYLLRALGDWAPGLVAGIEAIPSVNFNLDGTGRVAALLELVSACDFRSPAKLTLDRSLNRRPRELAEVAASIRAAWPELKLELLVNEGCLAHCPFRATHEALIAAANNPDGADRYDGQRLNRELACLRELRESPGRILASPFIRPEDVWRYTASVDQLKICGRTLGASFLQRAATAYAAGSHAGNLFELLDAAHWMADHWELTNEQLPDAFIEPLLGCDQNCGACGLCDRLFSRYARPVPFRLQDWRTGAG